MRLSRLAPYAAAAALAAFSPAALAAPRACRLVTDPAGDGRLTGNTSTPYTDDVYDSTDLDILSADVATDAKNVTAVVRLKTLRENDPDAPTGRSWDVSFVTGEQRYVLRADVAPDGQSGIVFREQGRTTYSGNGAATAEGIGKAKVVLDYARAEVRMTAPLSRFAPYTPIVRGHALKDLSVWSYHHAGTGGSRHSLPNDWVVDYGGGGLSHSIDHATSTRVYLAGAPSCVAVGR
jgi:hypothetical protein